MKFAVVSGNAAQAYTLTLTTATATTLLRLNVPVAGAVAAGAGRAYKAWVSLAASEQGQGPGQGQGPAFDVYHTALRITLTQLTGHAAALVRSHRAPVPLLLFAVPFDHLSPPTTHSPLPLSTLHSSPLSTPTLSTLYKPANHRTAGKAEVSPGARCLAARSLFPRSRRLVVVYSSTPEGIVGTFFRYNCTESTVVGCCTEEVRLNRVFFLDF